MDYKEPESITLKLKLDEIKVAKYQRNLSTSKIKKIINNFNPHGVGVLIVSYRDGEYYIVDGQHRMVALLKLGIMEWKCEVYIDLTYQQEAEKFKLLNTSKNPTPGDRFISDLEAGKNRAVTIKEIVEKEGYKIAFNQKNKEYTIGAVSALESIYDNNGGQALAKTLRIIKRLWGAERNSLRIEVILGMNQFLKTYENDIEEELLINKLLLIPFSTIHRKAMENSKMFREIPASSFARAIVECYNKGKRSRFLINKFKNE